MNYSPLRKNIGLSPCLSQNEEILRFVDKTPVEIFEILHNPRSTKNTLKELCHYLLRILYPSEYAQWRLEKNISQPTENVGKN